MLTKLTEKDFSAFVENHYIRLAKEFAQPKCGQIEKLYEPVTTLLTKADKRLYRGKKAIRDFWQKKKDSGMTIKGFGDLRILRFPVDMLFRWDIDGCTKTGCYKKYNDAAVVTGTFRYAMSPGCDEEFLGILCHIDDCSWGVYLEVFEC